MKKIVYTNEFPKNNNGRVVIIYGDKVSNKIQYLSEIYNGLNFPHKEFMNWDGYLDWIRDLGWIDESEINIIIVNFKEFLKDDQEFKKYFIEDFTQIILPYWENKEKEINLFLVNL